MGNNVFVTIQEFGCNHTDTYAQNLIDWRACRQLQVHGVLFNPQDFYTVSRRPQRRSALQAVSREYEVTFSKLESQVDKIKLILGHILSSLIQELQTTLQNFSHRVRVIQQDLRLSFQIHIPFKDHDDFSIDLCKRNGSGTEFQPRF